jgi:hypothetical protein
MALTGAERQRKYRENRKLAGDNGYRQINVWVSTEAALALKCLARRNGVTQRELIERLWYSLTTTGILRYGMDCRFATLGERCVGQLDGFACGVSNGEAMVVSLVWW